MKDETNYIKKSIDIKASDDRVWQVLTNPEYTNTWAVAFSEGTYVETDWSEGSDVIWKMADGEVAAQGKVEVNYAPRLLKINYPGENKDEAGADLGEYHEHYSLLEQDGSSVLTIESGPLKPADVESHAPMWDKAIALIKTTAEQ